MAKENLYFHRPYSTVMAGSFEAGDVQWFPEGGLNVSYNCVDRHAYATPDKVSLISDSTLGPPGQQTSFGSGQNR